MVDALPKSKKIKIDTAPLADSIRDQLHAQGFKLNPTRRKHLQADLDALNRLWARHRISDRQARDALRKVVQELIKDAQPRTGWHQNNWRFSGVRNAAGCGARHDGGAPHNKWTKREVGHAA